MAWQSTLESSNLDSSSLSSRAAQSGVAIHNSAQAESNQINGACEARNLKSVVGGLGGQRGDKGGDFAIQAPPSPFERTLSQTKLESSHTAQKVESSMDCHADFQSARNDRNHVFDTTPQAEANLDSSKSHSDSKILDEKCGLQGKSQGSYLSGNDRSDFSPLPHFSLKAESPQAKKE